MTNHPPCNSNASPGARALLARLQAQRGKVTLSAQHDYITSGTRYFDAVAALLGRSPTIFGSDFSFEYHGSQPDAIGHCGPANLTEPGHETEWEFAPEKIFAPESRAEVRAIDLHQLRIELVERCIRLHRAGTIITLMWHGPTPDCGDCAGDHDLWHQGKYPEEKWQEVITPGTEFFRQWEAQVDRVAAYLKLLADADVPVLWRPYHEMNGGWFWWGHRTTPGFGYARLWRNLFNRLTVTHGLNNLLWVWNPNAPRVTAGDEAGPYADYYPGGDVVDVLATDIYHNDYRDSHATDLLALAEGRLIALGEVGHLPSPDYLARHPDWSWVMPWGGLLFRFNSPDFIQSVGAHLDGARA
ncbi:MAG: glycosyl hydrolase [Verrucomicrobia bacterium]|nr:glycosyl hydrolase [Verrucomicrobiota bacterium]